MENEKEILKLLKEDKFYKEEDILKKFKITSECFYETLIEILKTEIKKLDFDQKINKYKYLYKIFKYFDSLENETCIAFVNKNLRKLRLFCNNKISKSLKDGKIEARFNNIFYKIVDIIDVTLLKLEFEEIDNKDKSENNKNYQFLKELIYNIKNYEYIYEIFKTSKKLMYTTNPKGESLLEELIEHYIEVVIIGEDYYDIIYFEKVIKIFLDSKKFIIDKDYTNNLINKIFLRIDNLKRQKVKKHEIQRIRFFLTGIVDDLKNIKHITDLEDLDYKYGINKDFPTIVLEEVENLVKINGTNYQDFRDKFIITIDSPGTRMYDDACFFEKNKNGTYTLGVFVVDVDALLTPNSLLEQEAFKRIETIYLPNNQITMFPREFSNRLSLNEGVDRFSIAFLFNFDSSMNLETFDVKRALIKVCNNIDYIGVSHNLRNSDNIKLYETLKLMLEVTNKIRETQVYDELYETVKKIKRYIENNDDSNYVNGEGSILSTFVVLMNHYVALHFKEHPEIPFPYHVNLSQYDDYIIRDLKQKIYSGESLESILDCLNQIYVPSFYSTENLGHNGLNLTSYCSAGNPLRQYVSIITQRLIKNHIIDRVDDITINMDKMNEICEHINNKQKLDFEYKQQYMKTLYKKD